jgi:hypothetical protein
MIEKSFSEVISMAKEPIQVPIVCSDGKCLNKSNVIDTIADCFDMSTKDAEYIITELFKG